MSIPALILFIASQVINLKIYCAGNLISDPDGGSSSNLRIMYTFLNETFTLKHEIEDLKRIVDKIQTKILKVADDMKDMTGPRVDITKDFKTAKQSSEYLRHEYPLSAELAIDGSLSTFSHTNTETKPWWSMEFYNDVTITVVRLRNRFSCCDYQMKNIVVTVGNEVCGRIDRALGVGQSVEVTCPRPLIGKTLTIQRTDTAVLSIAEVQVFSPSRA